MNLTKEDARIEELRRVVAIREVAASRATACLAGEDAAWTKARWALERKVAELGMSFDGNDQPSKAVYLLGRLRPLLEELLAPFNIIKNQADDEEKLSTLLSIRRQREERGE